MRTALSTSQRAFHSADGIFSGSTLTDVSPARQAFRTAAYSPAFQPSSATAMGSPGMVWGPLKEPFWKTPPEGGASGVSAASGSSANACADAPSASSSASSSAAKILFFMLSPSRRRKALPAALISKTLYHREKEKSTKTASKIWGERARKEKKKQGKA